MVCYDNNDNIDIYVYIFYEKKRERKKKEKYSRAKETSLIISMIYNEHAIIYNTSIILKMLEKRSGDKSAFCII